jgi:predicted DNA-binding transcriptional regulator AlpA
MQIVLRPTPEALPKGEKLDRFVPWQELAAALGVGFNAINGMIRRGELPHMTKIGLRRSGWYEGALRDAGVKFRSAA